MKYLKLQTTNPYWNLAIEEYLFRHADDDVFMLWQNEPTVVIGKNQNVYAEIDMAYIERENIHISRRITGGGAVYHDLGNLNYTFISVSGSARSLDFATFTSPVIEALATLGAEVALSGRNDLEYKGKKFSGNAQYSKNGRVLHHGTLLFDSDLDALSRVLKVDPEKIEAKAIKSTRGRVTNLKPMISGCGSAWELGDIILGYVRERFGASEMPLPTSSEIQELCLRNSSREWLYPQHELVAGWTARKKRRYPFGTVDIHLDMSNDFIRDIRIRGDFFGSSGIEELENRLRGSTFGSLSCTLEDLDVDRYIYGMSLSELIDLIREQ